MMPASASPSGSAVSGGQRQATELKVCLVSAVPSTLAVFYRPLLAAAKPAGVRLTLITSPGEELDQLGSDYHLKTYAVPILRRITPLVDLATIRSLVGIFRQERFDLVHSHMPKGGLLGMTAARLAGVPHRVHTMHGLPSETASGLTRLILKETEALTCRLAHKVCMVSNSARAGAIQARLCGPEKAIILGNGTACGLDLDRFSRSASVQVRSSEVRRRHDIPVDAIVIGFQGRFVVDKGLTELVEAFEDLSRHRSDLHLLLLGSDGTEREGERVPAETLNTIRRHSRITHAGFVEDPVPYYVAMDICVLPSRREGFPYAILESAALGVPAVANRVTGSVDAVEDGQTGLIVDPDDPLALREAVRRLADDPELRHRLGAAAAERVRRRYSSEHLVSAHWELYRTMAASSGQR
jgi:glycosyltransferase involved in cell wall biosynthesis